MVLTKAIGPDEFIDDVREVLPGAEAYVRVLASKWGKFPIEPFGLNELVRETLKLLPMAVKKAFVAAQKIDIDSKRSQGLMIAAASATTAALGSAVPVPGVGVGSFIAVNVGMLISIAAVVGVEISTSTATAIGTSAIAGLALSFGVRMAAGELLKFIPGFGSVAGSALEASAAAASTYGIGHAFTEFLLWFYIQNKRMPDATDIESGFLNYWKKVPNRSLPPPAAAA